MSKASKRALQWAVDRAGGESQLARAIGTTPQLVRFWLAPDGGKRGAAAEYVLPIERATGISRHSLRPDIYPRDSVERTA